MHKGAIDALLLRRRTSGLDVSRRDKPVIAYVLASASKPAWLRSLGVWNAQLELAEAPHKIGVLRDHCADVGRDPGEIEMTYNCKIVLRDREADARAVLDRQLAANTLGPDSVDASFWAGTVETVAERMAAFVDAGFGGFTIEEMAPFHDETLERLIGEVKPLVERG